MAKVIFSPHAQPREVEDGLTLVELDEQERTPVPMGCYAGHCAACMIRVQASPEDINAPTVFETYTLTREELAQGIRLGCQLRILGGQVTIALY